MRGSGAVVRSVSSKRFDREEKKEKKRKEKREELEGVGGVKGREIIWNRTVLCTYGCGFCIDIDIEIDIDR